MFVPDHEKHAARSGFDLPNLQTPLDSESDPDAPWWALGSATTARLDADASAFSLPDLACTLSDGQWTTSRAPPAWYGAADVLKSNRDLEDREAFALTNLLAGGDAADLRNLLRGTVEVAGSAYALRGPSLAVDGDATADLEPVSAAAACHKEVGC